jgi:hypothetical protein
VAGIVEASHAYATGALSRSVLSAS